MEHATISINSLLESAHPDIIPHVYIIHPEQSFLDKNRLLDRILPSTGEFNIEWIEATVPDLDEKKIKGHVSNTCLIKYDIPNYFCDMFEWVFYLDADTICRSDLYSAILPHLKSESLLLGCMDEKYPVWGTLYEASHPVYANERIGDKTEYFNSGVLLMNAKKLVERGFPETCRKLHLKYGNRFIHFDQDVINVAVANHWEKLPARFNVHPAPAGEWNEHRISDVLIYHMSGRNKLAKRGVKLLGLRYECERLAGNSTSVWSKFCWFVQALAGGLLRRLAVFKQK